MFKAGDEVVLKEDYKNYKGKNSGFAIAQLEKEAKAGTVFTVRRDCDDFTKMVQLDWFDSYGHTQGDCYAPQQFTRVVKEKEENDPLLIQIGGGHYKKYGVYQPWEVLFNWLSKEEFKGAMKKEVIAYLAREDDKGGFEDIKKAFHTLQIYLDLEEKREKDE